jgi:hypothetical protein
MNSQKGLSFDNSRKHKNKIISFGTNQQKQFDQNGIQIPMVDIDNFLMNNLEMRGAI